MKNNPFEKVAKTACCSAVIVGVYSSFFPCQNPNCPKREPDLPTELNNFYPGGLTNRNVVASGVSLSGDTGVSGTIKY